MFAVSLAATLVARNEGLHVEDVEEGVVVAQSASLVDDKRAPIPSESPLPEDTRVEIVGRERGYVAVRLPSRDAWIADQTILTIAKIPVECGGVRDRGGGDAEGRRVHPGRASRLLKV